VPKVANDDLTAKLTAKDAPAAETPTVQALDILRTVFPVISLSKADDGQLARADFFGTAFCVAPNVFMTAAHVVHAAEEHGTLGLAGPGTDVTGAAGAMGGRRVDHREIWDDRDVPVLYCNAPGTLLNRWMVHPVQVLEDLGAFGYPHAVTRSEAGEQFNVLFRAYKGYVITTRGFERLAARSRVYELSCPFPEGLSGAPVLYNKHGVLAVAGMVLGESTVEYGGVDHRVGIALMADEIVGLHSERLRGGLAQQLDWEAAFLAPSGVPPTDR